ncbi:protein BLISTER-like isoform X2 [Primulina huaijiensis]|uniref:protein BLISTER-like isoform X2 n=1 Tax=Primulina huaijiensis TaxID=1492673 RepID=UPI003CC74FD2
MSLRFESCGVDFCMASPQVLKKQEQLAAGRRKLEEFRRKKALEKAKKATSTSLLDPSDDVSHEKQPSESERLYMDDDSVLTYDTFSVGGLKASGVVENNETNETGIALQNEFGSSGNKIASSSLVNKTGVYSSDLEHSFCHDKQYKNASASLSSLEPRSSGYKSLDRDEKDGSSSLTTSSIGNDSFLAHSVSSVQEASSHFNDHGLDGYPLNISDDLGKDLLLGNSSSSTLFAKRFSSENSVSTLLEDSVGTRDYQGNTSTFSPHQESVHSATSIGQRLSVFPDTGENRIRGSVVHTGSMDHSSSWIRDHINDEFDSDARRSSNNALPPPSVAGKRSRPSFLDSIHISKGPSSPPPHFGESKFDFSSSKVFQKSATSFIDSGKAVESPNHFVEAKNDFFLKTPNEDFSTLEQHIEDLTQEKFSLQRGLEASRALAESLASENSALTDSYNQQGSLVHQLKADLEKLHGEIKLQLVELEAVKLEYANAQLECNAADERAKLLASEVIGLEEKALRLRSNELKLERQVENYQAEISSDRKKMSSLEKECQDLHSTINALQEEKKILQSRLLKASSSEKSYDTKKTPSTKKDVSTSTEDLDTTMEASNSENLVTASLPGDRYSPQLLLENRLPSLKSLSLIVPSDHMRMIQNINTLIAELAMEKDHLTRALSAESSQSSTLMELNEELTRKLEVQTQRLELLTTQSMTNNKVPPRRPDTRDVRDNIAYADEGDEVVERVLGWIMKLFPGGPSRRTTSKRFSL